ncbi:MAG: hypothetical protein AB7S38_31785 [Vulcanimicrobiota bacterium]
MPKLKAKSSKKYACSCGQTFSHPISLKRHRTVSGCAEVGEEAPKDALPESLDEQALELEIGEEITIVAPAPLPVEPAGPPPGLRLKIALLIGQRFFAEFFGWLSSETAKGRDWAREKARPLPSLREAVESLARGLATVTVMSVFFFVLIMMSLSVHKASAGTEPRPDDASQSVSDFYKAVNAQAYQAAYQRLTPAWREALDFGEFESGYGKVDSVYCYPGQVTFETDTSARVAVTIDKVAGDQVERLVGYYLVVHDGANWNLDRCHLVYAQ